MSVIKYDNILSEEDILSILSNETVVNKKLELNSHSGSGVKVKFSIELPDSIKEKILLFIGLDLSRVVNIPMRWIKGDTAPHVDRGERDFSTTYLIYLSDSRGNFIINEESFDINKGSAFVFNEGLSHETVGTENDERLLIGPMSEFGFPVGSAVTYFRSLRDAETFTNPYTSSTGFTVVSNSDELSPPFSPYFAGSWVVQFSSDSSYPAGSIISPSTVLNNIHNYSLYPNYPCFLEGTKILCKIDEKETYLPIELLEKGMLVKTALNGYKKIDMIGTTKLYNPNNVQGRPPASLYHCSKFNYPELFEDLYITGHHSILVDHLSDEQREKTIEISGNIYITGNKYRLMACVDDRAYPLNREGIFNIWHIALENDDYYKNYGIYANGLLVETTSKRYLKELSGMILK